MRKYGNRYSSGLTLTDREAVRLSKIIMSIEQMAAKENRFIGEARELRDAAYWLRKVIKDADRAYVFD